MNKKKLIPAVDFCASHNIEISFINSLQVAGLVEITTIKETEYINENHLHKLEQILRLYYELDINLEGIETIIHLLQKIKEMREENTFLKNRLRLYEAFDF